MLTTGRYAQWKLSFLRYINTRPNGDALRKCILQGPYTPSTVTILAVPTTDNTLAVPERTAVETILNISPKNKAPYELEKEAIHSLLTGIGDEIYSTVDACKTAHEIFYKMMNEMIRNNLIVATMQVNVQFLQQLQPEWSRFVTIFKQQHDLDTVSYHKLFNILKQYQKEVNEIRAERIAKNANLLALVAAVQPHPYPYCQAPKSHKLYATQPKASPLTRSHATTRHKGKEIAKPITPPSESTSEEDSDPEQAQRDKDIQKKLALIEKYKNDNQTGQFGNKRTVTIVGARETEPKRVKDSTYHKKKMLLCKQAEIGVPLQAEQSDWLADTDEDMDEQELEAHYSLMAKIQEKLIEKCKGKSVETKFDKPSVVRQPNAQRIPKPSVLGKLTPLNSLERKCFSKTKSVPKTNVSKGLTKPVTIQILPLARQAVRNTNVIKPGMYQIDTRTTQTRAPYLKSRTLNVNVVYATCGKCVFNSNHDTCVSKFLNDVNARIKKPKVVPISPRKPKSQANKSAATHLKKTVASEFTIQKSKSYYRMLYEKTKIYGPVRFGNDQFALILGYGDLVQGNIAINRVYYVEGLNHDLFSVGQFCDADLKVAFQKSTCFVRDLQGNDLLIGNRGSDLYTSSLQEMIH
nr:integrase, catalytic region, zinc finger, CCHC-type, peptidase aspartic, catalytic [Tanacetum cinerariifolium]